MWVPLLLIVAAVGQVGALETPTVASPAPDVVVVCPEELRPGLDRWLDYRSRQGHRLVVIPSAPRVETLIAQIRQIASGENLRFVVLIGDAPPFDARAMDPTRTTPTAYVDAVVNVRWGSPPHIATDNPLADLNGDGLPDLALGRIPADTVDELRTLLDKTIAYEQCTDFGPWRRRLNFVAGVGDFGLLIDMVIESVTKMLLVGQIPSGFDLTMTHASYRSPYCPGPTRFRQATIDRLNEGSLFWVYMGHGHPWALDRIRTADHDYPIFECEDLPSLASRHGWPIAVFFACYTGAFDATEDCLAERMVLAPHGPVAVYAASRVSMPYAMSVMGSELIDSLTSGRHAMLGPAIVEAKRRMVAPDEAADLPCIDGQTASHQRESAARTGGANTLRKQLDAVAEAFRSEHYDPAAERLEHVLLFNLLGDPMLRLPVPRPIELQATVRTDTDGARWVDIMADSPMAGQATVDLVVRRDRLTFTPPTRATPHRDHAALYERHYAETYIRANDRKLEERVMSIPRGPFRATLRIPAHATGDCDVRLFVQGDQGSALGALGLHLKAIAHDHDYP